MRVRCERDFNGGLTVGSAVYKDNSMALNLNHRDYLYDTPTELNFGGSLRSLAVTREGDLVYLCA